MVKLKMSKEEGEITVGFERKDESFKTEVLVNQDQNTRRNGYGK